LEASDRFATIFIHPRPSHKTRKAGPPANFSSLPLCPVDKIGGVLEVALRSISRVVTLFLLFHSLSFAQAAPTSASDQNSILNLYDAFGYQKRGTILDWGFSALIHYNGKTILFDTGNSADGFEHNVKALGVDLQKVDIAVLSHRHVDHISGFDYMLKVKPEVKAYLPADPALGAPFHLGVSHDSKESLAGVPPEQLYFGGKTNAIDYKPGERFHAANAEFVPASREIAPGVYLIVTRSVMMGDFNGYPPNEPGHPDMVGFPEVSLALKTEKGMVLITGCSHSKVEEIVRATKQFTGSQIELVEGGFHLFPYERDYIVKIAQQMKDELGVRRVAPAHCTGNLAFKIFRDMYGENYNYAGVESEVMFGH
jgi:7,8-dihydropterin-6-yl-methyl-4-(beta-D-ribofuranosyl)aminobenzene 5'-phosphate synthase